MFRQRVRIRFRKEGDLRLISHQDLLRTFERLFRRADFRLRMTAGFHPRPHVTLPAALALGVEAHDEVMEFELSEELDSEEILRRLQRHAPPGLAVFSAETRPAGAPKAQVVFATYELPLPADRRNAAEAAAQELLAAEAVYVPREGRKEPIEVRAGLAGLELDEDKLRMRLRVAQEGSTRPREILAALHLDDLLNAGAHLTRTQLELADDPR